MTDVMVLALMIFYVNSSGYTEATVLPGVYFFAASAIITMLAYGWANTVPAARRAPHAEAEPPPPSPQRKSARLSDRLAEVDEAPQIVTLPTNPGRRHKPA
jgi:paraquat-inducible protein A